MQAAANRLAAAPRHRAGSNPGADTAPRDRRTTAACSARCRSRRRSSSGGDGSAPGPRAQRPLRGHSPAIDLHRARLERGRVPEVGPIARAAASFFDGTDVAGELEFKDGEGRRLALFPDEAGAAAEASSGGGRAVPAQRRRPDRRGPGRADAPRRNAARQPDRPAQSPRLHRSDRESRRDRPSATSSMRCWWSTCCASAGSMNRWAASPATNC